MKGKKIALGLALASLASTCATFANEPNGETKVVYPASATSRVPIVVGPTRTAETPVREGDELDVETPLGQIAAVRAALDSIQTSQLELERVITDNEERIVEALAELEERWKSEPSAKPRLADICLAVMAIMLLAKNILPIGRTV